MRRDCRSHPFRSSLRWRWGRIGAGARSRPGGPASGSDPRRIARDSRAFGACAAHHARAAFGAGTPCRTGAAFGSGTADSASGASGAVGSRGADSAAGTGGARATSANRSHSPDSRRRQR